MNLEDLKSPELQEKMKAAKTAVDLVEIAKAEGVELTDAQLQAISGGAWDGDDSPEMHYTICTECHKQVTWYVSQGRPEYCPYCGNHFFFGN